MKNKLLLLLFLVVFCFQELHSQNLWKGYINYGVGFQPRNSAFNSEVIPLQVNILSTSGNNKNDHGPALHNISLGLLKKYSKKVNIRLGINYQNVFRWNGDQINTIAASYMDDSLIKPREEKHINYGYKAIGFEFAVERNLLTKNKNYNLWLIGGLELAYLRRFDSYELFEVETNLFRESFTATYDDFLLRGLVGISAEKILTTKLSLRLDLMANPLYYFTPYQLKINNYLVNYQSLDDQEYRYSNNAKLGLGELTRERIIQRTFRLNFSFVFSL